MKTDPPKYQQPPIDPTLAQQDAEANTAKIDALQDKLKGDTSSVMARYGALVALSGAGGSVPKVS